jgi:hypothetical protein
MARVWSLNRLSGEVLQSPQLSCSKEYFTCEKDFARNPKKKKNKKFKLRFSTDFKGLRNLQTFESTIFKPSA